jgi:hypothetical protein
MARSIAGDAARGESADGAARRALHIAALRGRPRGSSGAYYTIRELGRLARRELARTPDARLQVPRRQAAAIVRSTLERMVGGPADARRRYRVAATRVTRAGRPGRGSQAIHVSGGARWFDTTGGRVAIAVAGAAVLGGLAYAGYRYYQMRALPPGTPATPAAT